MKLLNRRYCQINQSVSTMMLWSDPNPVLMGNDFNDNII